MMRKLALLALPAALLFACAKAPAPKPADPAPASTAAPAAAMDAKALYAAKCAGCHAADGSKGLQGKSAEFVVTALSGYKAKTYGGPKKEIMEARAAQLSDADIKALAGFIAKL